MAVHVSLMREGVLTRPSNRTWQRDAELGANTLTIANGHTIDAMRFVTGDFARLSAVVATQAKQWLDTGTNTWLDVTSPDNILISGRLANGAVASVAYRRHPLCRQRLSHGDLRPRRDAGRRRRGFAAIERGDAARGAGRQHAGADPGAGAFTFAAPGTPSGEAVNVGQMYALFARAIRGGDSRQPTFETAVELHRLVDAIKQASDNGREVRFG